MSYLFRIWGVVCSGLLSAATVPATAVVINEIMYHPASGDSREEYIELYNPGPTDVNLSGWRFTSGVQFTFPPNTVIPADGYLVVAAHRQTFLGKYPGRTNVVGDFLVIHSAEYPDRELTDYRNTLSNTRNDLDLDDAAGTRVDSVEYADDGDWGVRQRSPVLSGQRGWIWSAEHDGGGKSLELRNPNLPNEHGQNWGASLTAGGTPGVVNSLRTGNVAPLIVEAQHLPIIPRSTDPVSVTARVIDESAAGLTVALRWRIDGAGSFETAPMLDDGASGDGAAGDGIYGARLAAMPNNTLIEFYLEASDGQGNGRTWPAPALEAADLGGASLGQVANAVFQVDDQTYSEQPPMYKLIMTGAEYTRLGNLFGGSPNSDAQVNATFISIDADGLSRHYLCGVRNRGHGSRNGNPHNYRINFPAADRWKGVTALNLNARSVPAQVAGATFARKAGAAGHSSRFARLRVNNGSGNGGTPANGLYAANEDVGPDWAERQFPNNDGGNIYSVVRDIAPPNFNYRGENPGSYMNTYFKESNNSENDWNDLMGMLAIMGENQTASFITAAARDVIDVEQWLTHLAVMNLFGNNETGLNTGYNDDYFLYRGVNDPRFILVYHDLDSVLGIGSLASTDANIFRATQNPGQEGSWRTMNFFMRHPDIQPIYYRILQNLLDTTFSQAQFDPVVDQLFADFPTLATTANNMKSWMAARRNTVQGVINGLVPPTVPPPRATISGEPRSPTWRTSATLTVGGTGITHYRWRLNSGGYSLETPVSTPIQLSGLAHGSANTVSVLGRYATNALQTVPTISATWVVNTNTPTVRLNEVLARNDSAVAHAGTFPDLIELYNEGTAPVDLSGLRLTDDPAEPGLFTFPPGTSLAAGAYLVLYANLPDGTPGFHLGFALGANGDTVYLYDRAASGGALLDSVAFGPQISDRSIGRFGNGGAWVLTQPTFGAANAAQPTGNPGTLKINEWLAASVPPSTEDFLELYNPDALPVALGGLFLTDEPLGVPLQHAITPLSFVAAGGFVAFVADGAAETGPDHLNFRLASEQGRLGLFAADGTAIDNLVYGPQQAEVAMGRCPDGAASVRSLNAPTPGVGNFCPVVPPPPVTVGLLAYADAWRFDQLSSYDGVPWMAPNFDDSGWSFGPGVLARRATGSIPQPILTQLQLGRLTYYFRTTFSVAPNANFTSLQITHLIDDGAVVYLNGQEAYRHNMPSGPVNYNTFSASGISGAPPEVGPVPFPMTNLVAGVNTIAVEVHQSDAGSSDIYMGLKLEGVIVTNSPTAAGLLITEVLANNASLREPDGSTPDYVELYNPSSSAVDLGDASLSDTLATPRRWVFPAGTFIPAQGYLVVRCDADLPASATNTGFGLGASGDSVYLFTRPASGGGVVDFVTFGLQTADYSVGRLPVTGTNWVLTFPTLGATNLAAALGDPAGLRINEWMADPETGDDWFEIYNPGGFPVSLAGLRLTDSFGDPESYRIPALSYIGTGSNAFQRFEADDPGQPSGAEHVNFRLSRGGDNIYLLAANNATTIDAVTFGEQATGVSQGRFPDGNPALPFTSFPGTASPGAANYVALADVVISEVLTHTDPPLEDAIEVQNLTASPVDISGWFLSDSASEPRKYRIPDGTVLAPGGFAVFYEYQFNNPDLSVAFGLSSARGDEVYLSTATTNGALTGYRAFAEFGAAENGVSFGRHPTSVGADFFPMTARTFGVDDPATVEDFRTGTGATNAYPVVGPVVISEIMYHPPDLGIEDNLVEEFVELYNRSGSPVPLYDPAYPTNRWRLREGVDFDFPPDTVVPAEGYLLVVSFDPNTNTAALATFRNKYGSNSVLVGPYSGRLDNGGETVELRKPDAPETAPGPDFGFVPYVVVERVTYSDRGAWPTDADGLGKSLQRLSAFAFGNDPANWTSGAPTPGPGTSGNVDSDGDGMPDAFEIAHGFNHLDPDDAAEDADQDGRTNLEEYFSGTDPRDDQSYLRVTAITQTGSSVRLEFTASAGKSYSVLYRTNVAGGPWTRYQDVEAPPVTQTVVITDSVTSGNPGRFYRIVTPAWP